ncbi:MAG: alkaline phosphatase family protein, partial [Candidatus Sulfotelmatobacter sp.]
MKTRDFVMAAFLFIALIFQMTCSGNSANNSPTTGGGTTSGSGGGSGTGGSGGGGSGGGGGGCSGSGGSGGSGSGGSVSIPLFAHVFIVLEENHSFSDIVGNAANMTYLNGLIAANSLATQYYADAHPSLPNYFMLTVGEGTSITGTEGDSWDGVVTDDNVVRALTAAGKSWKAYAEALPSVGYLGGDTGAYLQHHVPVVYFSDVQQSSTQAANVVPFTQLATDIANNTLPDYAFIT